MALSVGSFGDILFLADRNTTTIMNNVQISQKANLKEHDRHRGKALVEWVGSDPMTLSLDVFVSYRLGDSPSKWLQTLQAYVDNGYTARLYIGKQMIGKKQWIVESYKTKINSLTRLPMLLTDDLEIEITLKEWSV